VFPRRILALASALLTLACLPSVAGAHGFAPDSGLLARGLAVRLMPASVKAFAASDLPSAWCGDDRATDVPGATDGLSVFHAVYAIPADQPSQLQRLATGIQADAAAASGILESQRGRAIRFDLGSDCGPRYLDITTLRLPETTAQLQRLAEVPNGTLSAVTRALKAQGFATADPSDSPKARAARLRDFVVWLDGPYPPAACGQADLNLDRRRSADNLNNGGGKVAVIFRYGDGFCGPSTVLHEIGHTIGAVQPKPGQTDWTGHCSDDIADVMCDLAETEEQVSARTVIDANSDDYWDPSSGASLGWWTINLSRFLCPDVACSTTASPKARAAARRDTKARVARARARAARIARASRA
jgi:hypothetical protein